MKRDVLIGVLIGLYSLVAAVWLWRLSATASSPILPSPHTQQVKAASTVRFATEPNAPDPNQIFALVNKTRLNQNLPALNANEQLTAVAIVRAKDMAHRQYYAHKNPDGLYYYDLFARQHIHSDHSCENLDLVFGTDAERILRDWITSTKGHSECLTGSDYTEAGYAAAKTELVQYGGQMTTAYVVVAIHSTPVN